MGLVAGDRRPAALARSDDAESDVRGSRNGPRCPTDRHRSRTMQNNEGMFKRLPNRSANAVMLGPRPLRAGKLCHCQPNKMKRNSISIR